MSASPPIPSPLSSPMQVSDTASTESTVSPPASPSGDERRLGGVSSLDAEVVRESQVSMESDESVPKVTRKTSSGWGRSFRRHSDAGLGSPSQSFRDRVEMAVNRERWEYEVPGVEFARRVLSKPRLERSRGEIDGVLAFLMRSRETMRFFRGKSDGVLRLLAAVMHAAEYRENEVVFDQGSMGDLLYIVVAGSCGVYIDVDPALRAAKAKQGGRNSRAVESVEEMPRIAAKTLYDLEEFASSIEVPPDLREEAHETLRFIEHSRLKAQCPPLNNFPRMIRLGVANGIISDGMSGIDPSDLLGTALGSMIRKSAARSVTRVDEAGAMLGIAVPLKTHHGPIKLGTSSKTIHSTSSTTSSAAAGGGGGGGGEGGGSGEGEEKPGKKRWGPVMPLWNTTARDVVAIPTMSARIAWTRRVQKRGRGAMGLKILSDLSDRKLNIATILAGNAFGELALQHEGRKRAATVRADQATLCFTISREDFRNFRELRGILDSSSDQVSFISGMDALRSVPRPLAVSLAYSLTPIVIPRGSDLLLEGECSPIVYIIRRGECLVQVAVPTKRKPAEGTMEAKLDAREAVAHGEKKGHMKQVPLGRLGVGSMVGLESVMLAQPSPFNVRTTTECAVFEIGFDVFRRLAQHAAPDIIREWMGVARHHAQGLVDVVDEITKEENDAASTASRTSSRASWALPPKATDTVAMLRVDTGDGGFYVNFPDIKIPTFVGGAKRVGRRRLHELANVPGASLDDIDLHHHKKHHHPPRHEKKLAVEKVKRSRRHSVAHTPTVIEILRGDHPTHKQRKAEEERKKQPVYWSAEVEKFAHHSSSPTASIASTVAAKHHHDDHPDTPPHTPSTPTKKRWVGGGLLGKIASTSPMLKKAATIGLGAAISHPLAPTPTPSTLTTPSRHPPTPSSPLPVSTSPHDFPKRRGPPDPTESRVVSTVNITDEDQLIGMDIAQHVKLFGAGVTAAAKRAREQRAREAEAERLKEEQELKEARKVSKLIPADIVVARRHSAVGISGVSHATEKIVRRASIMLEKKEEDRVDARARRLSRIAEQEEEASAKHLERRSLRVLRNFTKED